ncbi:histone-lysine N-methyltransferase SETMAR [Plakobranchus ocellatus]|uniref:Histone-lysine N-methyltransferase SETMAR n=1 Tax=Plakobranchus ocellatus TaxID=259542 RepID=A0AAV3YK69_9GAST|nr:histone-lysine N-methyltransferase SETMAR [Plakobranchus ocellatus]
MVLTSVISQHHDGVPVQLSFRIPAKVNSKMISGFQALRQARALVSRLDRRVPVYLGVCSPLGHQHSVMTEFPTTPSFIRSRSSQNKEAAYLAVKFACKRDEREPKIL